MSALTFQQRLNSLYSGNFPAVMAWAWKRIRAGNWMLIVSGLVEPILFLVAMGYGVGALVRDIPTEHGPVPYVAFIAPAMLAVSTMNGSLGDTTYNVYFKMRFDKVYGRMLNTSLGPLDIAIAEISMALLRGTVYAIGFTIVLWVFGLLSSPVSLLMIPVAVLLGAAFASFGMGLTSFATKFQHMAYIELISYPLFVLSGVFFPLSYYPEPVQWLVQALPLWHGVELMRSAQAASFDLGSLVHVAYLLVLVLIGLYFTTVRLRKLFLS